MNTPNSLPLDSRLPLWIGQALLTVLVLPFALLTFAADSGQLQVGLAVRDVTPDGPIWLAGYAARKQAAAQADHPLLVQAVAFQDQTGERFVLVSVDNCEVSRAFMAPVLDQIKTRFDLGKGRVMTVSSHTHSAPVLEDTLVTMYHLDEANRQRVEAYSQRLRNRLVDVVGAALEDLKPATLEFAQGQAGFAMNRRVYRENGMAFGENPDGPVDHDVPVLKILDSEGALRGVIFGYACHGTSIAGDDFYIVSGDYMAYTREHLEALYPGAVAVYVTGMGADSNPSPRGQLLDAKRHGLELAGAVAGVLKRPMRPVVGPIQAAFQEVELPLEAPPSRAQLEKDAAGENPYIRSRAEQYLSLLDAAKPLPASVPLPIAVIRFGNDLTLMAMGGEVVADYSIRLKRLYARAHPWTIGYAYEVPCYIPTMRILKEGGYEADSSLIYYGFYGPFRGQSETAIYEAMANLMNATRSP